MRVRALAVAALALAMLFPATAQAGWKQLNANAPVKVGTLTLMPLSDWNQASRKPGKQGAAWTRDGFNLNAFEVFADVPAGQPMYKERSKKNDPMPKFDTTLLLPELGDFFERSFRANTRATDFAIEGSEPVKFAGGQGLEVRYRYSLPNDELQRRGVARLAVVAKKLYVTNFYAPDVHYFSAGLGEAQALMDNARF